MGVFVFVGRNWISLENSTDADYYLSEFIHMALPEEDIAPVVELSEEDYLSHFISRSFESAVTAESGGSDQGISSGNVDVLHSRFFSTFSELDPSSCFELIRLTLAHVSVSGMAVFSKSATLICYTLGGEGDVITNGRVRHCRKYDCVWTDCEQRTQYRAYPGAAWECVFLRLSGHLNSDLFQNACNYLRERRAAYMTFGAGARFRSLIWELLSPRTEANPNSESLYNHLLLGVFLELDMAITSAEAKPAIIPNVIIDIQNYIDRNYPADINLDLLAKNFSISKFHMAREFKRYLGKSPIDYLIDVRINRAKALLTDSDRPISDICQLVGIPNPSHFLYLFKEREGVTPSAFRKFRL